MKKRFLIASFLVATLLAMFTTSAQAACVAPKNLNVTERVGTSVKLNWSKTNYALRYQLQAASTGSYGYLWFQTTIYNGNATSYKLNNLAISGNYRFRVRAFCSDGQWSPWSDWKPFNSGGWFKPGTDEIGYESLYATDVSETSAKLNWKKIDVATQYQAQVWGFLGEDYHFFQFDVENPEPVFKVENLTPGHDYVFRVRAFNKNGGWGPWSDEQEFTTLESKSSRAPKLWANNLTSNSAQLNWEKTATADRYQIQIGSVDSENYFVSQINCGEKTNYLQTELDADKTYAFKVRSAQTGGDWGEWSEIEVFTTHERNQPTAAATSTDVKIWPNPASDALQIRIEGTASARRLTLVSAAGQIVREDFLDASQEQHIFHVADLPMGVYYLRTETGGIPQIQKVVITH